jgi:hypothetical protein
VILIDTLLVGGLRFVLDKLAAAVDSELNDDANLQRQLLEAQMRLELGEIGEDEFRRLERDLLARIREIQERRRREAEPGEELKVTGVEASFVGEEHAPTGGGRR